MSNKVTNLWGREPALILGAITAVAAVMISALAGDLDDGLIMAAVAAVLAVVTRTQVSPATDEVS